LFGAILLISFFVYVWLMYSKRFSGEGEEAEELYACKLIFPKSGPGQIAGAVAQLLLAALVLYFASDRMVESVSTLAANLNISALGLALLIVPAATAIPETISALIWAYRGKDTLALGSLVGEKILYSTVYPGLGLFLTQWNLDAHAYSSVAATTVVSVLILYFIKRESVPWYGLLLGIIFFVAYAYVVLGLHL
jgi:cation:H+ antiporter